ncbi:MAG TPA: PIG-L family deacetylase [Propionicimonas sp.]|uniref:PIG-L deacetylase family protein n=1 Tax=Propionicimonas sp. TaxID=1955623 RepID=UPI002F415DF7
MTLLVVVAHPDDETFGCGSLLLHAAERTRTVVICATRGEAGDNAGDVELPPGGLGQVREAELRSAAGVLGVAEVEVLGYRDSGMAGPPAPGSLCEAPLELLVDQLREAIARHRPAVVVTLDGSDGHRDHLRVREALVAAAEGADLAVYLSCLPRSLMQEWLRYRDGGASSYAEFPDLGTPETDVTTVIDARRHYPTRLLAIAQHRSQASPFDDLPEELRQGFLATDHLTRVQPPWEGGPAETDLLGLARPRASSSGLATPLVR